jgi:malonyl-ACP O-methyltransferase BioC
MKKELIAQRFSKAGATYAQEASVQRLIADKMIYLLAQHTRQAYSQVLEFGCGTGIYSRLLLHAYRPDMFTVNDLCDDMKHACDDLLHHHRTSFLSGDAEYIPFPGDQDLITSCSALQWFESPERFFRKCHTSLHQQGILAFSTFGEKNMQEVRSITGQGLPYRSLEELIRALRPRFELIHAEEESITLSFDHPMKVLYHLKQTGVNGLSSSSSPWTRGDLQVFCQQYIQQFSQAETAVPLTYHPIYIIAQKRTA